MKNLTWMAGCIVLLTACGGGSGGNSPSAVVPDPADDEANGGETVEGAISGRVLTALDDAPLADAEITLLDPAGATLASTRSGVDGIYRFDGLSTSDVFQILITFESYLSETYSGVQFASVGAGDTLSVEPVRLVSNDNAGDGSLTGTITGAVDGLALGGLTLEFIRGINNRDGELVATTTTDDDGSYTVSNLPYGNYTCIIVGVGLETTYTTVYVVGGTERGDQNGTISPSVTAGETRIVLTWGESPSDLDSHLTGPGLDGAASFHVFYRQKVAPGINLDVDDTSSFGPETVTIADSRPGVLRYTVNRFSLGAPDALSASSAKVQVIRSSGIVAEFFVPQGEGNIWSVFDIVDGTIRPLGIVSERTSVDDYFAPETRIDERRADAGPLLEKKGTP